jgi:hypothetical protein
LPLSGKSGRERLSIEVADRNQNWTCPGTVDIESLPEGARGAARHLRTEYDMKNHAVASGAHAQSLDAEFIHRFGIAGPVDEASARFDAIRDAGIDFVRIVPGSRDMPREVGAHSIQALGKLATGLRSQ